MCCRVRTSQHNDFCIYLIYFIHQKKHVDMNFWKVCRKQTGGGDASPLLSFRTDKKRHIHTQAHVWDLFLSSQPAVIGMALNWHLTSPNYWKLSIFPVLSPKLATIMPAFPLQPVATRLPPCMQPKSWPKSLWLLLILTAILIGMSTTS